MELSSRQIVGNKLAQSPLGQIFCLFLKFDRNIPYSVKLIFHAFILSLLFFSVVLLTWYYNINQLLTWYYNINQNAVCIALNYYIEY